MLTVIMTNPIPLIDLYAGMSKVLEFDIPDVPRGKARPVVTKGGGHVFTPDPAGWGVTIASYALEAVTNHRWNRTDKPLKMTVDISRKFPKGFSKKKRAELIGMPVSTIPDLQNIIMNICDVLEGIVYENDKQIALLEASRVWGDEHRTTVSISMIEKKIPYKRGVNG